MIAPAKDCRIGAMSCCRPTPSHPLLTRRAALQAGSIGLLGLGIEHLGLLRSMAAAPTAAAPRAKSVIYIFLSGGLAQHESFDMKPDAPQEVRGEFNPIRTRTPGLHICEHLPELAKRSHKWALVRSLTHPFNEHSQGHHVMLTGRSEMPIGFDPTKPKSTDWPSMAAVANAVLRAQNNLPPAVVLPDKIVHRSGRTLPGQFGGMMGTKGDPWFLEMSPYHPEHYGAFPEYLFHHPVGGVSDPKLRFQTPHLALPQGLHLDRLMDRVGLRDQLEAQARTITDAVGDEAMDRHREAALGLVTNSQVHAAFSLDKADPRKLDRYGRNSFGWSLLVARQLVEAGISMIQVNLGNNECWDTHQSAFPNLKNYLLPPMDRAVSALIDDLDGSGMLDETLIVMGSEFGRTPKISRLSGDALPGRDHWGGCQSVLLAGGGVRGGAVIGSTDKIGAYPDSDPQHPENLAATIYEALGIPREVTWRDLTGRPHYVYHGDPIRGLM